MCGILGPIGLDGPLAGLWRQAAARPQSKQPRTAHNPPFCAPIDYSPCIDSLFAGSPIKNCLGEPIS